MDLYKKKYEDALELARDYYKANLKLYKADENAILEDLFPELVESEDEKVRKELIVFLEELSKLGKNTNFDKWKTSDCANWIAWLEKQGSEPNWYHHNVDLSNCSEEYRKAYYDGWNNCNMQHSQCKSESNDVVKCLINGMKFYYEDNEEATWGTEKFSMKVKDILTWLEKQGEQKPADKVEPKFHKGEWITNGDYIWQIASVTDLDYILRSQDGNIVDDTISHVDEQFHSFTIEDAKPGDMLCYKDEVFLYKHDIKNCTLKETSFGGMVYYCCYDGKRFITDSMYSLTEKDKDDIHPVTKEQRDILFQKIKEEGYEWDAEKKELKKIEQTSDDKTSYPETLEKAIDLYYYSYGNGKGEFEHLSLEKFRDIVHTFVSDYGQKPAWSEEDEEMLKSVIATCELAEQERDLNPAKHLLEMQLNWLKSIKQRIGG